MKLKAGFAAIASVLMIAVIILAAMPGGESIKYEGKKYILLEYPGDIFAYDLKNGIDVYEDEETVSLEGSWWPMVYNGGDVFCHEADIYDANAYYNNHENYDWYVAVETGDTEVVYPIEIAMGDFEYIYNMENMEKDKAVFFDEIDTMGSLIKVSKDGFIQGITGLAEYEGEWYWRTEIIDEDREKDGTWPEYIIKLPDSVNKAINGFTKAEN